MPQRAAEYGTSTRQRVDTKNPRRFGRGFSWSAQKLCASHRSFDDYVTALVATIIVSIGYVVVCTAIRAGGVACGQRAGDVSRVIRAAARG